MERNPGAPGGITQEDEAQAGPSVERILVSECRPVFPRHSEEQQLGILGFPNLAQSCYMNSTLQSVLTLEAFCQKVERTEWAWGLVPSAMLLRGFDTVAKSRCYDDPNYKRTVLKHFKWGIAQQAPEFRSKRQNDAHGFLTCLLGQVSALSPLLSPAAQHVEKSYTCPVDAHLHFHMLSTRTCSGCEAQSSAIEDFTSLSLSLEPGGSVSQALETYLTESPLEYACQCGAKTSV